MDAHDPSAPQGAEERLRVVQAWVRGLDPGLGLDPAGLRPASSDASFRRYFRLPAGNPGTRASLVVMDAPPERENCGAWVRVGKLLAGAGVRVPRVLAADVARGLLLIEDFGTTSLWDAVTDGVAAGAAQGGAQDGAVEERMRGALDTLLRVQRIDCGTAGLPDYDQARLRMELGIFTEWYLGRHLGARASAAEEGRLAAIFDRLVANALAQPRVPVHRDFHSRNLMVIEGSREPGVLDFQDAVIGPVTYDLASLLRDAYLDWEPQRRIDWAVRHWGAARRAGIAVHADFGEFWRELEWTGLQRSLKILGIFARLHHRDGKPGYLPHLPRVLGQAWDVAQRYDALRPLAHFLDRVGGTVRKGGYSF